MLAQKLLAVAQVGGTVVLYLLMALSVLSIGVIIERTLWFRRRRVDARGLSRKLSPLLAAGDRAGARKLLAQTPSIESEVLLEALDWYERGPDAVGEILATGVKERRKSFEGGLLFLGTLGNNAPFIGLFGTVLGVVTAFRELGANATGAMGNVMSGIAEALVATAVGILVALPAVIAYNLFQKKTLEIEDNVAALGGLLLAEMKGTPVAGKNGAQRVTREEPALVGPLRAEGA
jgi:biopolymer transport protein ExbB/biopolymer transport protein TolQ